MTKERLEKRFRARLGSRVAKHGADGRISANAFAQMCGLTSSRRVTDWLEEGARMPSAENLCRISDALGVSVDWLLGFDVPEGRGSAISIAMLEDELAIHIEQEILLNVRSEPYAFHLATQVVDGRAVLRDIAAWHVKKLDEAWRQASAYTDRSIGLLKLSDSPRRPSRNRPVERLAGGDRRGSSRNRLTERMAIQAAIFREAIRGQIGTLRTPTRRNKPTRHRPLLEVIREVSPIGTRTVKEVR